MKVFSHRSLFRWVCHVVAFAAPWAFSLPGQAQEWPGKPVKVIVPFPPGGGTDTVARPLTAKLSQLSGQQFIIDNKGGAGGTIGAAAAAKSPPDGYTIIMLLTAHAVNATLMPNLPYDTVRDFSSITLAATLPLSVVVNAQSNIQTVQELIAYARANPGKLNYGSARQNRNLICLG